ncbi:MAG TPA: hypothetical protein VI670_16455 [Thermoanaerobaculia bacterium]|jgi:acyl carrier protein
MTNDSDSIRRSVIRIVADMCREWEISAEDLGPETQLARDLQFSSIDFIHLLGTVEMTYQKKFPYDRLVVDAGGRYRSDLTVGEIIAFIEANIDRRDPGPMAIG